MPSMKLDGKKILIVIPHTQFRDEEFFEPKKILEDEGAKVVVASTTARLSRLSSPPLIFELTKIFHSGGFAKSSSLTRPM